MSRLITYGNGKVLTTFAIGMLACYTYAAPAPYAKFEEGMLSKTRPVGWLGEACRVQAEGLTGHPEALSYPYGSTTLRLTVFPDLTK